MKSRCFVDEDGQREISDGLSATRQILGTARKAAFSDMSHKIKNKPAEVEHPYQLN